MMKAHGLGFTALLGGLSALPALATDMALPSVSLVQAEFGSSAAGAASAISVFLAGFATAPLAVGPLADRFGRKPVMLAGLALFALAAIGCALAPSIAVLIAARVAQGAAPGRSRSSRAPSSVTCSKAGRRGCNSPRSPSCSASRR